MKKLLLVIVLGFICLSSFSQNLQLHYDFRNSIDKNLSSKNYITATFEMFKPDKWGSTFMFVDFDLNATNGGMGLAYMEIARDFKIGDFKIMPHIEYNGGLGIFEQGAGHGGFSVSNSYLAGASYSFFLEPFFINTYIAYKLNAFAKSSHDVQWTMVWNSSFFDKKVTFNGFVDVWTENKDRSGVLSGKKVVLISEPQIWYNINEHLSIGSEIEISNNFIPVSNKLEIIPTIAAKWNF